VRQIASEGTTVLLTTQYLEEADRLAERLAVVDHGRVIAEGTSRDLKSSIGGNSLHVRVSASEQRAQAAAIIDAMLSGAVLADGEPTTLSVKVSDASVATDVLGALSRAHIAVTEFSLGPPSLDDVFLALTGRHQSEESASNQEAAS
jgi:ABC-2 type transport system ATP-binding protein